MLLLTPNGSFDSDSEDDIDLNDRYSKQRLNPFALIRYFSRLLNKQLPNLKNKSWLCYRCLNSFVSKNNLEKHSIDCSNLNKTQVTYPKNKV